MNARDVLARDISAAYNIPAGYILHEHKDVAALLIEAGWTKPRTITTTEELDALPEDAVVFTNTAWLRVMSSHGLLVWGCVGSRRIYTAEDVTLPATVLYEPQS